MAQNSIHVSLRFYAQFNTPSASLMSFHLSFVRLQFITSFTQCIVFVIPVLTAFLQLKYQGNDQNNTPFATHPTTMLVAISSFVVHYLAYVSLQRLLDRRLAVVLACHCLVWSGHASVASLASVLFPDSVRPFVYAIFILLPASEMLYWLYHKLVADEDDAEFQIRSCRRFRRFLNNNIWRIVGNSSGQWLRRLPI